MILKTLRPFWASDLFHTLQEYISCNTNDPWFLHSPHFLPIAVGFEVGGGGSAVIEGPPAVHWSLQWGQQHLADALWPQP